MVGVNDETKPEKQYWFPAKKYGYGWGPPRCWQGWLALIAYVGSVTGGIFFLHPKERPGLFLGYIMALTAIFILICYLKGEKPGWRWGGK
jgi:hypothetical protein